jgi:hypothetical protein
MRHRRAVLLAGSFLAVFEILIVIAGCGPFNSAETGPGGGPGGGRHHPAGFADSTVHGPVAKAASTISSAHGGSEDCRGCHGANLDGVGGATGATSCDSCHTAGWRANCTFCHGGTNDSSGAPPRDLSGKTAPAELHFRAHATHLAGGANHRAFDCVQCHLKPTDALSQGHWINSDADTTPMQAEVLSSNATCTTSTAGCLNVTGAAVAARTYTTLTTPGSCTGYCHDPSKAALTVTDTSAIACMSCHPVASMSGRHTTHMNTVQASCYMCHESTVSAQGYAPSGNPTITDVTKHLNGSTDVVFHLSAGTTLANTYNPATRSCNGTCHDSGGSTHTHVPGETWN